MIKFSFSSNGMCVAYAAAEVTVVPYFELINSNIAQPNKNTQQDYTEEQT